MNEIERNPPHLWRDSLVYGTIWTKHAALSGRSSGQCLTRICVSVIILEMHVNSISAFNDYFWHCIGHVDPWHAMECSWNNTRYPAHAMHAQTHRQTHVQAALTPCVNQQLVACLACLCATPWASSPATHRSQAQYTNVNCNTPRYISGALRCFHDFVSVFTVVLSDEQARKGPKQEFQRFLNIVTSTWYLCT